MLVRSPFPGLDDAEIWALAQAGQRLVVTSDRDFERRRDQPHFGLIVIRPRQPNSENVGRRAMDAICEVEPDEWPGCTIVVRDRALRVYRSPAQE